VLFWVAALGIFKLRKKRESSLRREEGNLDFGEDRIADSETQKLLQASARKVHVEALLAALLLT
jgi:hypothetical protein